ncbi:MAG: hypothetical protein KJ906_02480 [Nanoarchaeota archaeon]|nr:hypothetical protein [Nanoarchaeota archaeon]
MNKERYEEREAIKILADKDKARIISLLYNNLSNEMKADDLLENFNNRAEYLYPHILDMIKNGTVKEDYKGFGTPVKETGKVYTLDDKFSQTLSRINEEYPGLINELGSK